MDFKLGIYLNVTGDVEIENTETISNNGWGAYIYFTQRDSFRGLVAAAPAPEVQCVGSAAFTITHLTANDNAYDGLFVSSGIVQVPVAFASIVGAIVDSEFEYNLWNGVFVDIQRNLDYPWDNGACTSRLTVDGSVAEENGYDEMIPFTTVQAAAPAVFAPFSGFTLWSADTQVSNSLAEANYYAGVLVSPNSGFYDTTVPAAVAAVVVPTDTTSFQIVDSTLLYNEVGLEATDTRLVSVTNVTAYSNTVSGVEVYMEPADLAAGGHADGAELVDHGQWPGRTRRRRRRHPGGTDAGTCARAAAANGAPQATVSGSLICRNEEAGLEASGLAVDAAGQLVELRSGTHQSAESGRRRATSSRNRPTRTPSPAPWTSHPGSTRSSPRRRPRRPWREHPPTSSSSSRTRPRASSWVKVPATATGRPPSP